MSPPQLGSSVRVTNITLNVRQESDKTFDRVLFRNQSGKLKEISPTISPGGTHKEVFDPPLELSIRDRLLISMWYPSRIPFRKHSKLSITVQLSEVNSKAHDDNHGHKTFFTFHKGVEVVIGIPCHSAPSSSSHGQPQPTDVGNDIVASNETSSPPTTSEILNICPRFRLLIIGNTGVGKSTLIRKVFGVKDVDISEASRGRANIEREFIAEDNGLFVLHDSLGLEAGDSKNMNTIKGFIDHRRSMEELKDKLHAIWVCLAVPFAKGRLLETGMEEFLKNREHILGDIPVIIVLTKLDLLETDLKLRGVGATDLEEHKIKFLDEYCTKPLQRVGAGSTPRVSVSAKSGFKLESTIPDLVRTTTSEIERYVRADPSYSVAAGRSSLERDAAIYIAAMAQRASIEEKVNLTIALGKQRYWRNLGACVRFSKEKVKEHILVVHEDIIQGWNFNDPDEVLRGDNFKAALLDTSNLGVQDIRDFKSVVDPVMSIVPLLEALMSDIHATIFALPIAGAVILPKLCYEVYKSSQSIVKRFVAYIVDLIYVMKILFILAAQQPITSQDVALALQLYEKSAYRNRIHLEIRDFSPGFVVIPGGREEMMEKIEVLINRFNITDQEMAEQRRRIEARASDHSTNVQTPASHS